MAITNIYKGDVERSDIQKIYKGTTLLYEKLSAPSYTITSVLSSLGWLDNTAQIYIYEIDYITYGYPDLDVDGVLLDTLTYSDGTLVPSTKTYTVSKKYLNIKAWAGIPNLTVTNHGASTVKVLDGDYGAILEINGDDTITWNFRDDN